MVKGDLNIGEFPGFGGFDETGQIYNPDQLTPPKFNIAPKKWWLEDYFPIRKVTFQGLC